MIPASTITPSINTKSMEDVWKDISLASLYDQYPCSNSSTTHHPAAFRGMIFQDFLATTTTTTSTSNKNNDPPPPPIAPASTVLSLNSGTRYDIQHQLGSTSTSTTALAMKPMNPQTLQSSHYAAASTSVTTPCFVSKFLNSSSCLDALNSTSVFPSYYKKRALDHQNHDDHNYGDRRHKRMIKNRESAARSRSRKQAYTNELELELAHLREENARLKKEQAKFLLAAPTNPAKLPKRHRRLHRTSTAPF